ncbi:MAG: hypothetical protein WC824_01260 [Bacteroidota bacterium]|jgi:hypothetical protein
MRTSVIFSLLLLVMLVAACSEENPSIRVRNNLDVKANVQLKPVAGNTININDVQGNSTSGEVDVQEGSWIATATIQSSNADPSVTFNVENDVRYTVVIVNVDPPVLEVQSEDK